MLGRGRTRPGLRGRSVPGTARLVCRFGRAQGPDWYLCECAHTRGRQGVQGLDEVLVHSDGERVCARTHGVPVPRRAWLRACARQGRWGAVGARGGCGVTGSPARTSCLKEAPRVGTEPPMGAVCARAQALRVCMLLLEERVWAVPSAVGSLRLAPEGSASGSCLPAWRRRQPSVQLLGVRGGDPAWDHILLQG